MKAVSILGGALLVALTYGVSSAGDSYPIQDTPATGGEGTVTQADHNAFSLPQANLPMTKRLDFSVGNSFFRNPWVVAPSSTDARDGLGPLFNTNSCQGCHIKDGRGHPPSADDPSVSLFLRLSVPGNDEEHAEILEQYGFVPEPVYGSQLQTATIPGMRHEADFSVEWETFHEVLADGTKVAMRRPIYSIENANFGPLAEDLQISPRVAPPMIGLGLLEAIAGEDITTAADPDDADGNGISGKANQVWDRSTQTRALGRFGWKAGEPNIMQQSMGAFAGDMGITSALVPLTDCTETQGCEAFSHGGEPEVSDKVANFVAFYASSLAVPARREMNDPQVQAGAELFNRSGCAACHTPRHVTATNPDRPDLSNQVIWPYTDLLLHDMGPGLADHRPEFLADGNEWRTPPLWGIGLAQEVNPRSGFLHDGRAETLEQAILWHAGEAEAATENYRQLPAEEREALIQFLKSL
ncbi:MAG TPA: c-type cytochrome [Pseudomonas xinjiangensis]|uniref:C-type cytochrome n=2 Tax=root TaxID=1 RepID=A0A7V1BLF6_9GAMM|nr:c-type cytochrome [Halopseudomonas xinjiangensis]HEC48181.1 c-type cytochrome [Halopseudomonas xinjiangensis]